ncbi:MAG: hypothetical protein M3162_04410 [Thermoproteota archaeon]|nr:hypothetical protein [Thermoproteota archaeon]
MAIGVMAVLSVLTAGSFTFPTLADEHKDRDGDYDILHNCYKYDEEHDGHSEHDYHFEDGNYHFYCYLVNLDENDANYW